MNLREKIIKLFCEAKDHIPGGLADHKSVDDLVKHHNVTKTDIQSQLDKGIKVELEHTDDEDIAREIAFDHIWEDPEYYDKLEDIEDH